MDIQQITDKIATMQRAIKTATTVVLKNKLKSKIAELKEDLRNANVPTTKLAKSLLGSQRKVANYTKAEFKSAIRTLSKRAEYSFLKRYTIKEIEDDRERYAKPVGWRFKGRNNIKKPTAKELAIGKARGTVYYESRPNRSDVVRPVKLADGGGVGLSQKEKAIIKNYKETVTQYYNSWIKKTKDPDLKKLYKDDINDHLYLIERMEFGSWNYAYKFWLGMDSASREQITNDAYDLLIEKNNIPTYAKGGRMGKVTADDIEVGRKFKTVFGGEIEIVKLYEKDDEQMVETVWKGEHDRGKLKNVVEFINMYGDYTMAKGGTTKQPKGFNIDLEVESRSGNKEHYHIGKMKGLGDAYISRTALEKNSPDNYHYKVTPTNKYAKGGDIMPLEKYEEIQDEIHENKYDKGGSVSNAVDKHIATRRACLKHGATLDAYKMAHKHYAKGGRIGDSGVIQDPNSLYNGKMGTIVGEDGSFFLVKTTQGTGLVKKTRIKIVADDYAKGGGLKKKDEYAVGGNITHELDILWRQSGLTVYENIGIINALNDAGITMKDLQYNYVKGSKLNDKRKEQKVREIWAKAKPYYNGSLEGNEYYMTVLIIVEKAMQGKNILQEWKNNPSYEGDNANVRYQTPPPSNMRFAEGGMTKREENSEYVLFDLFKNKAKENYSKFCELALEKGYSPSEIDEWYEEHNENEYANGGKINSAYGDYVYTKLANAENSFRTMTKPENYTLLVKKDKSKYLVTTNKRVKMFTDEYEIYGYGTSNGVVKYARGGVTKKEFVGKKVGQVMHEFKHGELHSGRSGKIVKKRKQAVAIALNVANEGWKHRKKK